MFQRLDQHKAQTPIANRKQDNKLRKQAWDKQQLRCTSAIFLILSIPGMLSLRSRCRESGKVARLPPIYPFIYVLTPVMGMRGAKTQLSYLLFSFCFPSIRLIEPKLNTLLMCLISSQKGTVTSPFRVTSASVHVT